MLSLRLRKWRRWLILTGVLVGPLIVLFVVGFLWEEGYLGSHWEQYGIVYDPKMKKYRCLDDDAKTLSENLEPPCIVMSSRGNIAMYRHQKECQDKGGEHLQCVREAFHSMLSKRPKPEASTK